MKRRRNADPRRQRQREATAPTQPPCLLQLGQTESFQQGFKARLSRKAQQDATRVISQQRAVQHRGGRRSRGPWPGFSESTGEREAAFTLLELVWSYSRINETKT